MIFIPTGVLGMVVYDQNRLQITVKLLNLGSLWVVWRTTDMPNASGDAQVIEPPRFKDGCIVRNDGLEETKGGEKFLQVAAFHHLR
jgi:hypothetical protein